MSRRAYWLVFAFSALASFSYLMCGWHDETITGLGPLAPSRAQTIADHVAAIGFALARVVLTMGILEMLKEKDR